MCSLLKDRPTRLTLTPHARRTLDKHQCCLACIFLDPNTIAMFNGETEGSQPGEAQQEVGE